MESAHEVAGSFDVVVVGAGVAGSATAMALAERGVTSVAVLDLDLSGELSSSELNAGGVRATWSQEMNLKISKNTIEYFEKHAEQVGYKSCGYLWLHKKETFDEAYRLHEKQNAWGWEVQPFTVDQIRQHWGFIDKTDDLGGALFGKRDGLVNPNALKEWYRLQATQKGVKFLDFTWVDEILLPTIQNGELTLRGKSWGSPLLTEQKRALLEGQELEGARLFALHAKKIVNAAGAWAPTLSKKIGSYCPSYPVRRQISLFRTQGLDLTPYGMIIDPSGVYFHPEAIYGLAGYANLQEPRGVNFHYEGNSFFENFIWPSLYERSSYFENLKHISGWAGLYETSPDHKAIVGEVIFENETQFTSQRVYEIHSFSGHGVMQSYTMAQELAELMIYGQFSQFDLSEFSPHRFLDINRTLSSETWVI